MTNEMVRVTITPVTDVLAIKEVHYYIDQILGTVSD